MLSRMTLKRKFYEDVSEDDSEEGIEKAVSEGHDDKSDHSTEIWPRQFHFTLNYVTGINIFMI